MCTGDQILEQQHPVVADGKELEAPWRMCGSSSIEGEWEVARVSGPDGGASVSRPGSLEEARVGACFGGCWFVVQPNA